MSKAKEPIHPGTEEIPAKNVVKGGFTVREEGKTVHHVGLTKLEYMATQIMAAHSLQVDERFQDYFHASREAVNVAKALLAALEEDEKSV